MTIHNSYINDNSNPIAFTNHLSEEEIENSIAAIDANQIQGIAQALVAEVMNRLDIGIQVTDQRRHIVQGGISWISEERIHVYDRHSRLMKLLLPICIEKITKSFSLPSEFMQNGIVFDLLNGDKSGLLDQVENEKLKGKIIKGMDKSRAFSIKLKVDATNILKLSMELYLDEELSLTKAATPQGYGMCARECTI